jgi:hypothetical protein
MFRLFIEPSSGRALDFEKSKRGKVSPYKQWLYNLCKIIVDIIVDINVDIIVDINVDIIVDIIPKTE